MKKGNALKFLLFLIAFAVLAFYFLSVKDEENESQNHEGFRNLSVETFKEETGWGYQINSNNEPIIRQQYLPGVPGKIGFDNSDLAKQTGNLVIKKLKQGIFPPTISLNDLDSIGIRHP